MNKVINSIYLWLDTQPSTNQHIERHTTINWLRCAPFILTHIACLGAFFVEFSYDAVIVCFLSYFFRMFAITAFYHRFFSHRSFKTSRLLQFMFAVAGSSAAQRGPLWWSSHHRNHHKYSDQTGDPHSPNQHGFMWSHFGWFINEQNFKTDFKYISDLVKYPELVFLNRFDILAPSLYA